MSAPHIAELPERIAELRSLHVPKTAAEMRVWEWEYTILPNLRASRLPFRFHREITSWHPDQKKVFDQCRRLLKGNGAIVALVGLRGTGKTSIASQLIIKRAWNASLLPWGRCPPYRKMTDLISRYKPIYADFGSIETQRLTEYRDTFCRHPLVVIDELHECDDQRMKDRVLTDIVDRRYANLVDTLLISNQTPEEFGSTTNDSVLSRLSEHGKIIHCCWESFR